MSFDYEAIETIEGRGDARVEARDLGSLRLERCLAALPGVSGRVLEIGCGAGRHARALARYRPDLSVVGVDLSRTAIGEARSAGGGVAPVVGDGLRLPFRTNTFDAVVLFDVLEHVPNVPLAIGEVARVLKPGGRFHGFIPCEGNPGTLFAALRGSRWLPIHDWKRSYIGHIQVLTVAETLQAFHRAGLEPVDQSYSFHLAGQLHDLVDYWRRDRLARAGSGRLSRALVRTCSRAAFIPLWRLSYWESRVLARVPYAVGLHLTARKSSDSGAA